MNAAKRTRVAQAKVRQAKSLIPKVSGSTKAQLRAAIAGVTKRGGTPSAGALRRLSGQLARVQ